MRREIARGGAGALALAAFDLAVDLVLDLVLDLAFDLVSARVAQSRRHPRTALSEAFCANPNLRLSL